MATMENAANLLLDTIRDHWSDADGGRELVQTVLNRGAPVDAADRMGGTALARAASLGTLPVVQLLLQFGAALELRNVRIAHECCLP